MTQLFDPANIPSHLSSVPSLSFVDELVADPLKDQWFRLAAWTVESKVDANRVEDVVLRKSFLLAPSDFAHIAPKLESVGNVIGNLGKPGGSVAYDGEKKSYEYYPFYRDHLFPTDADGEPLAFTLDAASGTQLFVNPDIWMFLELEEMPAASGVWIDRNRGIEVLRRRLIDNGNLQIIRGACRGFDALPQGSPTRSGRGPLSALAPLSAYTGRHGVSGAAESVERMQRLSVYRVQALSVDSVGVAGAIDRDDVRQVITRTMEGGEKAFRDRLDKYGF